MTGAAAKRLVPFSAALDQIKIAPGLVMKQKLSRHRLDGKVLRRPEQSHQCLGARLPKLQLDRLFAKTYLCQFSFNPSRHLAPPPDDGPAGNFESRLTMHKEMESVFPLGAHEKLARPAGREGSRGDSRIWAVRSPDELHVPINSCDRSSRSGVFGDQPGM